MQEIHGRHADLSIERPESLARIARALSSPVRLAVIRALGQRSMSVGELSKALDVPMSTMALAVRTLEEAGLVVSIAQPGSHGMLKLCSRKLDTLAVTLVAPDSEDRPHALELHIPIGSYSAAEGIEAPCGMLSETQPLGPSDFPRVFYSPDRINAQRLWFRRGSLEYRVSAIDDLSDSSFSWLELSFEACSDAPVHRDSRPGGIFVELNGVRLGAKACPCDGGGRQDPANAQAGFLTTWRIDGTGTYLDHAPAGDLTIQDLRLNNLPYLSMRIGVDPNGENPNGLRLFGEKFGDYPQCIVLRIGYTE